MNIGLVMILFILGAILVWWVTRFKVKCPQCGSPKVEQVSKQILDFKNLEYGGLAQHSGLQAHYAVQAANSPHPRKFFRPRIRTNFH
jgi:hypothetical protein